VLKSRSIHQTSKLVTSKVGVLNAALQVEAVEQAVERYWRTVKVTEQARSGIRRVLSQDLDDERREAQTERQSQQRRIHRFKDERQKLLDAYYDGAIPVDLLRSEQHRIGRGIAQAQERMVKLATSFDRIEEVITRAVAWADSLHRAYQAADEQVRRLFNQAVFKRIFLGPDGVVRVEYTEGFESLLAEDTADEADWNTETVGEELTAAEEPQPHDDKRPRRRAKAYHRGSAGHGWNVKRLVEVSGLEPPTSTLRTWRSTS
jgi:hypothetical protein